MASTPPSIGSLDRKIAIESYSITVSASGERTKSAWRTFAEAWANVTYQGGDKGEEDEKITAVSDISFTIRYMEGLQTRMRIRFEDKYYAIRSIDNIGRRKYIDIKSDTRTTEDIDYLTADMTTIKVDSTAYTADAITI
jgi:SPP1 family predicted phage head-tail adaptor